MYAFGTVLLLLIHLIFWVVLYFVTAFFNNYGMFCVLDNWFVCLIFVIGIAAFLSPFLTVIYNIVKKEKRNFFRIGLISTVTFVFIGFIGFASFHSYYSNFTPEKWATNQCVRNIMMNDLKDNHALIGMSKTQVIEMLGTPDVIADDNLFYYQYGKYGKISLFFVDEKVYNIEIYSNV